MNLLNILNHQLNRAAEADANKKTYARCQRKAEKLGVTIEVERMGGSSNGYWLHDTGWDDDNFCVTWDEVEDKLKRLQDERKQ